MTPPREDLRNLPPIAKAAAMHRPYRPSRRPMLYGLLITLAINLGWGAWALFGSSGRVLPEWARPMDILIPVTLLPPLTTSPRPRVPKKAAAPVAEEIVEPVAAAAKPAAPEATPAAMTR